MKRQNVKYDAHINKRREGDIVWKIPTRQGINLFLLLMLEFQTRVQWWMTVRVQVYSGLLIQQLIDEMNLGRGDLLPPILPIILYNGKKRWDAPTHMQPLISLPKQSPLWKFQPEARYHVIDERRYLASDLKGRQWLSALLFRLEHPPDPGKMPDLANELIIWFKNHPDFEPLKPLFVELLTGWLASVKGKTAPPRMPHDLLETKTMLQDYAKEWQKKWKQEGRQEGIQKGIQKGIQEGRQEGRQEGIQESRLLLLLQSRFGPAPDWVKTKLADANLKVLKKWTKKTLKAKSLKSVFK